MSNTVRRSISKAAVSSERTSIEQIKNIEISGYKEAIQNGMNIVVLSNDDKDDWKEKAEPIYKRFLETTDSEGQLAFDSVSGY